MIVNALRVLQAATEPSAGRVALSFKKLLEMVRLDPTAATVNGIPLQITAGGLNGSLGRWIRITCSRNQREIDVFCVSGRILARDISATQLTDLHVPDTASPQVLLQHMLAHAAGVAVTHAATEPQPAASDFASIWADLVALLPTHAQYMAQVKRDSRGGVKLPAVYVDARIPDAPWAEGVVVIGKGCHAFLALPYEARDYCYRKDNQIPTRQLRAGLAAQLTFYPGPRPRNNEEYRNLRPRHIVRYDLQDIGNAKAALRQVLTDFTRFQAEMHGQAHAAAEPGYVAMHPVQRLYLAALRILQDKLDEAGGSWLRGIGAGERKVDVSVVESLHTVYNPRNLISPVLDVVYSGIIGAGEWNKLRRQVGYNVKRNQVLIGIAGGGGKDSIVVPPGRNPREMLRNILETYVRNVREF